ncbi:endo-1,3-alpha-glucanase family glycosylhydrolase [Coraliomargarita algicola]|uniref:Endo-1,3-alpha-glucanase family glycosylhydrolase n=1 Tax=Coraliomargarita algicola TaxID=3092156 RepID=A0ABZ0RMI6_9BACT|nr:endo-1,3-alpha-glucanase family glycosylhydrolase [Coraliomargarita sp. J2-16]WPJ96717.1 endo-1,3-alpha-glucanase family glycosylhydrolase [Coraliomargarita sp. J2-16]
MPTTSVLPSWDDASVEIRENNFMCEIQMAQSMGIDGFSLDIMRANENYHRSIEAMFRAAERLNTGFKLFFEFDYGKPTMEERATDMQMLIRKYSQHQAYETVDGRPLVAAYAPDGWLTKDGQADYAASSQWWQDNVTSPLHNSGIDIYFVPTTFRQIWSGGVDEETSRAELMEWGDTIDGLSLWQIQLSPIGGGIQNLEQLGQAVQAADKSWMSTVSMQYWVGAGKSIPSWYWRPDDPETEKTKNGRYYEHAGGKGLDAQWNSIINIQKPEWVMMLTWNDYNESYFMPVDDLRKYRNGTGQAPFGWYKSMAGLGELNRYYIQWYKTGLQPEITEDTLFYSYRTSSHKLIAERDPRPPVAFGNGPISDDIYMTTMLKTPAEVRIYSGEETMQYEVPAGVHHLVVPFQAGRQFFALWRDGEQIAAGEGTPVNTTIQYYDYWPTTGFIQAGLINSK